MHFRKDAAALTVAAATAAGALALVSGAPADTTVALQVVPRGNGTVTTSVPDRATGSTSCSQNREPGECDWTFAKGAAVTLSAKPAAGATFAGWSTPDCPGLGDCKLALDDDLSVVAFFSKLTLSLDTSGANAGDLVTSNPPGISCPDKCSADFDAKSTVILTVKTTAGSTLTSFPYGCTSVDGATCTVTMLDEPQSVGVKFNNSQGPQQPDVVKLTITVGKTGDGSGRVTASGLDCGNVCFAPFPYGTLVRFSAAADTGSVFGGWGGLCASDSDPRCSLPIGAITAVHPKFVKAAPPVTTTAVTTTTPVALAVQFVRSSVSRGRLVLRFKVTTAANGTATLFLGAKQVARTPVSLRAGADALSFKLPRGSAHRHAKLVLLLGAKTFVYRVVVP